MIVFPSAGPVQGYRYKHVGPDRTECLAQQPAHRYAQRADIFVFQIQQKITGYPLVERKRIARYRPRAAPGSERCAAFGAKRRQRRCCGPQTPVTARNSYLAAYGTPLRPYKMKKCVYASGDFSLEKRTPRGGCRYVFPRILRCSFKHVKVQ